jgi:hypothetical protein
VKPPRCSAEPMTVALYVAALTDVWMISEIRRRLSTVSVVHQLTNVASPIGPVTLQ